MEDMKYITQSEIGLPDITGCLEKAGYEAILHEDSVRLQIISYYKVLVLHEGKMVETYCRWTEDSLEGQEKAQIRNYQRKDAALKYLFNVQYAYNPDTLYAIADMLRPVLECYGGYIYWEGKFFDLSNINQFQHIRFKTNRD